jgi:hypothetical protein
LVANARRLKNVLKSLSRMRDFVKMLIFVGRERATTKKFLRDVCAKLRRHENFPGAFAQNCGAGKTSFLPNFNNKTTSVAMQI